ncbi:uncharacterized protein LOC123526486 isoform X1 [Mercenaria mercenaria]|uniref:uncharacterized protein LOC123526486 isoform X1 n=1 Tax=Mercenaria mercenaria TaxID=6596 RepID=UPI00234E55D8|nr:uncharacterized protein LOC123526486 isoform X1 [Mercenaria mercenaria]
MKTYFLKQKFKQNYDIKQNVDTKDKISRELDIIHLYTFISITLTVLLVFLVSFVGFCFHKDVRYNLPLLSQKRLKEFSVLCEELSLSPDDDLLIFGASNDRLSVSLNGDGKYVCESKNLTGLVNKVAERETRLWLAKGLVPQPYLSCGNESLAPQSGYLTVALTQLSRQKFFSGDGIDTILFWENESEANANTVVEHSNGEIIVPEGRTYFAYASVHFNISRSVANETKHMNRLRTFSLRICRKIYGHEQTLLGETMQFDVSGGDVVSSFRIASHLKLNRNDIIYVKVYNANYVISSSKGNTFGFFPL